MKALRRILVAGTVAGLAGLTAASSGAFACTAQAGVTADIPPKSYLAPGEALALTIQGFNPAGPGASLVKVVLQSDGAEEFITEQPGPGFPVEWPIPATFRSDPHRRYAIVASQTYNGQPIERRGALVMIASDADVQRLRATTTTSPASLPTSTSAVPPPLKDGGPSVLPEPIGNGIGSARDMAPFSSGPPPAAPGSVLAVDPGSGAGGATPSAIDGAAPPPEERQAPALAGIPQVPAESLWSGLDGDGGASPSLLDAPAADGGGGPVGGILFGGGAALLALTGVALGVSRRRLALARR